jgi:Protein of unknown function (DUF732)
MSRRLVALVAGVQFLTPAPAAADPAGDPGDVQTLAPPAVLPSTPALDKQFLSDLTQARIAVSDVPVAISGARETCSFIAAHHTALQAMQKGMANNPTMTAANERAYVQAAIAVYCPRFLGMTDTLA